MFQANQQIGLYHLVRPIGRGGFGEVWLAERRTEILTNLVAIKLPHRDQVNLEAIRQEAQLWAKASGHANILPIIEANIYDGQIVIVSEFAPDGSLEEELHQTEELPVKRTIETVIGILNGLEFLHSRQIIHRDIKPANILLQGETPRLADFGISRIIKTTVLSTSIVGTPKYMAPEAFDGKRSAETDIWSVRVILYQMLTRKLPYPQENPTELMWAIVSKEIEPLPDSIPPDLRKIVHKALAKTPETRYQSAKEMREELQRVLLNISHPTFAPTEELPKPIIKDDKLTIEDKSIVTAITNEEIPPTFEESKEFPPAPFVDETVKRDQLATNPSTNDIRSSPTEIQVTEITNRQSRGFHWGFYFLPLPIDFIVRYITINFAEILELRNSPYQFILYSVLPMEVLVFAILGALFGYFFPQGKWKWGILLNLVFLFIAIFAPPYDQTTASLILALVTTITAVLTSLIAARLSPRKPVADPAQLPEGRTTGRTLRRVFYFLAPVIGLIMLLIVSNLIRLILNILQEAIPFDSSYRWSVQTAISLLTIFIVFVISGGLLGYKFPQEKWRWGIWLNFISGALFIYAYIFEPMPSSDRYMAPLLFLTTLFSSCLGSYLGARLAWRKSENQA